MEPISMMIMMGAGLGLQAAGLFKTAGASSSYNAASKANFALETKIEGQRRQAMELDARRRSLEDLRQAQRMRSVALSNSTSQGSAQGSGLQGGYGQISGQSNWNQQGISQNLQIGENIFDLNAQVSQNKMIMADAQKNMQTGQGLTSFGSSIFGAAGAFGKLGSGFGPTPSGGSTSQSGVLNMNNPYGMY